MLGKDMIFMPCRAISMEAAFANADTLPAAKRHIEKLGASKIWAQCSRTSRTPVHSALRLTFEERNATHDDDVSKPYVDIGTFIPKAEFRATPSTRA
jgi:hypothetical protein